jgi:hypothetical protein
LNRSLDVVEKDELTTCWLPPWMYL